MEFQPKEQGLQSGVMSSGSTPKMPDVELPKVNDTIRIAAHAWGGYSVITDSFIPTNGTKIIEVTVTGIKEAKVTYE